MITERIFTAPVAPYSCPLSGAIPDQATLAENIVGDDLAISISRPNQIAQLGTPGSIRITGTLRLSSNTLVIAGGSLSIATLRNDTGAPLSVTLLSAHGDITLGNTIGLISVLTVGRHKISAPSTAPAINYPFPSVRAATISGIIQ
jgi:hypothetical protein